MSTQASGKVTVMNTGIKGSLMIAFGNMESNEGCSYQTIDNPTMIALIIAATGPIPEGETREVSLQFRG